MDLLVTATLDTTGLICPEPVMMLHNQIRDANEGDIVKVVATDPSTQRDIPKFCSFLGHQLLQQEHTEQSYIYYIRKVAA